MNRLPIEVQRQPEKLDAQEQPLHQPDEVVLERVYSLDSPPFPGKTDSELVATRGHLDELGDSPVERAIKSEEWYMPPHPTIDQFGNTETREALPSYHAEAQKLFAELDKLKDNPNIRHADFEQVVTSIRQVVAGEIELLTRDKNILVDQEYLSFLQRLDGESQIVAAKLHESGGKLFMSATRERIAFQEFESRLELMELFPDISPEELLQNPELLKQKLQQRYGDLEIEIKPLSDFKSQAKAVVKGWKGLTLAGCGTVAVTLTGYVLTFAISEGSMSVFVGAYLTPPLAASAVVIASGLRTFQWYRKDSLMSDMRERIGKVKGAVWDKWFPKQPKPQVENLKSSDTFN